MPVSRGCSGNFSGVGSESRDVALTIPASAGYLVLARLALSAVCRLAPLEPEEIADLKLAVTESSNEFMGDADNGRRLDYRLQLGEDRLLIEVSGEPVDTSAPERELGRAIIEATVDEADFSPGRTVLTKRLPSGR